MGANATAGQVGRSRAGVAMTDIYNVVKDFLLADPGVAAIVGTRVYIDTMLPTGYQITDGPILVIRPNGGETVHYAMNGDFLMMLSYATTAQGAINLNEALFTALRRTNNPAEALIFYAKPTQRGTLIKQPGDMYTMLATYGIGMVV